MEIKITSPAFSEGGIIPANYSYNHENISPPLDWTNVPAETKSIALICNDPDAPGGSWIHWVIYNIPAWTGSLPEKIPQGKVLEKGIKQGINDFRNIGYDGPSPPSGTHRYVFTIYALDMQIPLEAGATEAQLIKATTGHILSQGQLTGKYKK